MNLPLKTGIDAKDRATVAEGLSKLLADTFAVYLKTHGYHWNVRGPNFRGLHLLLEEQYNEVWTATDELAERIRALGHLAPQGYGAFGNLSSIKDGDPENDFKTMLKDLIAGNETLIATARDLSGTADEASDGATADLANARLAAHEKHLWMLRATLGEE